MKPLSWPNGARIAVAVTVMFETWSEGKAPSYSVQATALKPGSVDHGARAWSTYGGRVGVWRIVRTLDRLQMPGTFCINAQCAEIYPEAVKQIARSGHDIAAHGYTQDGLLAYMTAEEQRATIRRCIDLLESAGTRRPGGWLSPVLAFTPDTVEICAEAGLQWHGDVTYTDLPHVVKTRHGAIAAVPASDFSDNRVLRASPRDYFDVYKGTFDYLYEYEPMSLLVLTLHCHFGGRPMIIAAFEEIMRYIGRFPNVWLARHGELARWALEHGDARLGYADRFLDSK
jgi:peptidoglycan/xylan/chitin deacetylase (PgdA/CDA1 family)